MTISANHVMPWGILYGHIAIMNMKYSEINNISNPTKSRTTSQVTPERRLQNKRHQEKLKNQRDQAKIASIPKVFITTLYSICPNEISYEQLEEAVNEVTSKHNEMIDNHQVVEGSARFALIRLYAIQLLEGQKIDSPERVAVGVKDRWPSIFNKLRPFYYRVRDLRCKRSDQIIRSILYVNRLCKGNSVIDTTEITKLFEVSDEFKLRYSNFLKKKYPKMAHGELISKPTLKAVSAGPNGKPKWQTAELEAYALIHSEYEPHFKHLCISTGNGDLYEYVKHRASLIDRHERVRLRYILSIADKGNKSRLIAISDYWTQIILFPIMEDVKSWVSQNYSNVESSYDHTVGFDKLKKFIRPGVMSKDIKSWTDAHPHSLQHIFMQHRYGKTIADAWLGLVVNCKWDVKGSPEPVQYGRGQGMGTAGSFDIATACDITILDMLYTEEYKLPIRSNLFNKVGDDLWCYDPDGVIHRTYTEEMGMEISIPKSKEATKDNLCGEFVSRNLNYGKDVSRISPNICHAVQKNLLDLPELIRHLAQRAPETTLDLQRIFQDTKVKLNGQHIPYVRAFYVLSLMYDGKPGMRLLRYTLINSFLDLIESDEFIQFVKVPSNLKMVENTYYLYSGSRLMDSIVEKAELISENVYRIKSLSKVKSFAEPDKWWTEHNEDIALKTSKLALSESLDSHRKIYDSNTDPNLAVAKLERIEQSLTFKGLGIISSDSPLRPTVSRLFKIVRSIVLLTPEMADKEGLEFQSLPMSPIGGKAISISIDTENRVMLPSVTEKYLGVRGLPQLPNIN